jgi:hypothetical protein
LFASIGYIIQKTSLSRYALPFASSKYYRNEAKLGWRHLIGILLEYKEKNMLNKSLVLIIFLGLVLTACAGVDTDAVIATGIAQTQQISQLETAAAGNNATDTPEPSATAEGAAAEEGAVSEVTTNQDVNMRSGDGTGYGVMTVIPGGEILQITAINPEGTWYQVAYHNASGWVATSVTTGTPPSGLPIVDPPPPQGGNSNSNGNSNNNGNGNGNGNGGGGNDSYSFTLDISNDGESRTVSGELTPGDSDYVTVQFEGFGGSIDTGHLRVILDCSAGEDEVELSESIPRSNHSNECNGDWDYQIEESDGELVIGMTLPSNFSGNVSWTMKVEVNN